jgi:hypothetical protein
MPPNFKENGKPIKLLGPNRCCHCPNLKRSTKNHGQGCCEPNFADFFDEIASAPRCSPYVARFQTLYKESGH